MAKRKTKITRVRAHPRRVAISTKNPDGYTIVDEHNRLIEGRYLDRPEIHKIFLTYSRSGLKYPSKNNLGYNQAPLFDELIAIWTDYFNKKFQLENPIDPDVIKALIASESGFRTKAPENKIAFGIMQITKQTLKISQDSKGEAKDFIFKDIRLKDLEDPAINIPMGIRWIFQKEKLARHKLKRVPTEEEIILEYKGLLKSNTRYKTTALKNFRDNYEKIKNNK